MKKILAIVGCFLLIGVVSFSATDPTFQSMESIWNAVFNSGTNTIRATISGNASLSTLSIDDKAQPADKYINFSMADVDPSTFRGRDIIPIWTNGYNSDFVITEIRSVSISDDVDVEFREYTNTDFVTQLTIDAFTISADGSGVYYDTQTVITSPTIDAGNIIALDYSDTVSTDAVHFMFKGYWK